jgi:GT2 family glycosyltransferase
MLVSIIIVNYRDYGMTGECLQSLMATTHPDYEVIVVDNESDPGELEKLARKFPAVRFFGSGENLYYAGGNNRGIREARGDLVLLLNNDTKVTPGWLEPLVKFAKENPLSFCQPQIFFTDRPDVINSAGNAVNVFGFAFPLGIGQKEGPGGPTEVFYCSGACVAATRKALDVVGMLDSVLYNYYEDVNWGWRARLLGIGSFVVPESVIYHKWGGSYSNKLGPKKFFYLERGRMATILRNFRARTLVTLGPSLLLIDVAMGAYCIKKGMFKEKLAAGVSIWKNLGSIMKERRRIQSTRTVVDDAQIIRACSRQINHPYFESSPAAKKLLDGLSAACTRLLLLL